MTNNLNINNNLKEYTNKEEESRNGSGDITPYLEEITVMKTEVKEEYYDSEMPLEDMKSINVKEEHISTPEGNLTEENLGLVKSVKRNTEVGNSVLTKADQTNEYRCVLCQSYFDEEIHLRRHYDHCVHLKYNEASKRYKCAHCKFLTSVKSRLIEHVRIHAKEKPLKCTYKNCKCTSDQEESCKCDMCGFATARICNLKVHILVKHSGEPKKYKCNDCNFATHVKTNLVAHSRIHTGQKTFKCTYKNCNCTSDQEDSCKCDMCGYAALQFSHLKQHILARHSGDPKRYKCKDCEYAAVSKGLLTRHVRIHTNEKPYKCTYKNCKCTPDQKESCKCDTCGYAAARICHLKIHILSKHSGEPKKYKCNDCNFATHLKTNLVAHRHIHTNERLFKCTYKNCKCTPGQEEFCKCDTCKYAAVQFNNLKAHILAKHSRNSRKYKCDDCNFTTHIKTNLVAHIRTHTGQKPFKCTYKNCKCTSDQEDSCKCDMCSYAASQLSHLKLHILTKHSRDPKRYKCRGCEYATVSKGQLTRHARIHTNERPYKCTYKTCKCTSDQEESCKCDTCGYAAARICNLKMHILSTHSGEPRKYKCNDCNFSAHVKTNLVAHNRIHTNERPFKCTYKNCTCTPGQEESCKCDTCEYSAVQFNNLKAHILAKHSKESKKIVS